MGTTHTIENQINRIKSILHFDQALSKSKIAHITGLHFFVVEDVLDYLEANGEVLKANKKYKLKNKEGKEETQ